MHRDVLCRQCDEDHLRPPFVTQRAPCRCLAVKSERIINNSVARLRPHHAAALLEGAVERLRTRARRGTELTVWIRAVLTHHTAYLMAAPGVLPILAMLSQVMFLDRILVMSGAGLRHNLDFGSLYSYKQQKAGLKVCQAIAEAIGAGN